MNDVFLFLAQGVPLLDERLRTPRALLSKNIKKREKKRERETDRENRRNKKGRKDRMREREMAE